MLRLLTLTALSTALVVAAPTPLQDPAAWLSAQGLVAGAHFELAHATYSVWRVRWRRPAATLQLVFASGATTANQAGTLSELTVTIYAPTSAGFGAGQRGALLSATRRLASYCGLNAPRGAPAPDVGNATPAEARQLSYTVELPAGRPPRCLTPTSP